MKEKDMTFRGLVRKIDDLGRVTIPKEYRNELDMEIQDKVEIFLVEEGGVYIKKFKENIDE